MEYRNQSAGRLTVADVRRDLAKAGRAAPDLKRVGHNRFTYTRPDGTRCFRLIRTDVVRVAPDGVVTVDDGGWQTVTTRAAIAEGLALLTGASVNVWGAANKRRDSFLHCISAGAYYSEGERIRFAAPFRFRVDGAAIRPEPGEAFAAGR